MPIQLKGHNPSRRAVLAGLAALPLAMALPRSAMAAEDGMPLHRVAARASRHFGTCVRMDQLDADPALRGEVLAQCSSVTPEIHLKWNSIENKRGQFWYEPVDRLVAFAADNNLRIHGHALLWEQSTPDWAVRAIRRDRDWNLVGGHIERVVSRYRDAIDTWDVVNEPIDTQEGSDGLRRNSFFRAFGEGYIARALEATSAHAPSARLMLNEYGFEYDNYVEVDRRAAFLKLLEDLRRADVPLHGVGIQAHLDLGKGPLAAREISSFLQHIADMGLFIRITELDVKEHDLRASIAERDRRVSDEVRRYLDIALAQEAVEGVTTWGITDRLSWLGSSNRGLPYDAELRPKSMVAALRETLDRPALPPPPPPPLPRPRPVHAASA